MAEMKKTIGTRNEGLWNDLGVHERVKMILANPDHFLKEELVTRDELGRAMAVPEGEWGYVIDRQKQIDPASHPLFTNIDVTEKTNTQSTREELNAALSAVFLDSKKPANEDEETLKAA